VPGEIIAEADLYLIDLGDTVPQVLASVLPATFQTTAFGALLVNRQFIIALAIGGVAYPLSLYRDIGKLAKASSLGELAAYGLFALLMHRLTLYSL